MDQQDEDTLERTPERDAANEHPAISDEDDFDLILLGQREERPGSTPGNVRIRVTLPRHQPFRRIKEGVLEATEVTGAPEEPLTLPSRECCIRIQAPKSIPPMMTFNSLVLGLGARCLRSPHSGAGRSRR